MQDQEPITKDRVFSSEQGYTDEEKKEIGNPVLKESTSHDKFDLIQVQLSKQYKDKLKNIKLFLRRDILLTVLKEVKSIFSHKGEINKYVLNKLDDDVLKKLVPSFYMLKDIADSDQSIEEPLLSKLKSKLFENRLINEFYLAELVTKLINNSAETNNDYAKHIFRLMKRNDRDKIRIILAALKSIEEKYEVSKIDDGILELLKNDEKLINFLLNNDKKDDFEHKPDPIFFEEFMVMIRRVEDRCNKSTSYSKAPIYSVGTLVGTAGTFLGNAFLGAIALKIFPVVGIVILGLAYLHGLYIFRKEEQRRCDEEIVRTHHRLLDAVENKLAEEQKISEKAVKINDDYFPLSESCNSFLAKPRTYSDNSHNRSPVNSDSELDLEKVELP